MTQEWARLSEISCLAYKGTPGQYALEIARACVDSIVKAYQRREPMETEERDATATQIVLNFPYLTPYDLKAFESKLTSGLIGVNVGGQIEYKMFSVDRASIMERLNIYAEPKRPKDMQTQRSEPLKEPQHVPLYMRNPYWQTHDIYKRLMPEGWDFKKYWETRMSDKGCARELEEFPVRWHQAKLFYDVLKRLYGKRYGEMLRAGQIPDFYDTRLI